MKPARGKHPFVNREAAERADQQISFSFGANWAKFLAKVDATGIENAQESLQRTFGLASFRGTSFLDVGCGSGLFSLAAIHLGASPVISIDTDPASVACAMELRRRVGTPLDWRILRGSILDRSFVKTLPRAQHVYSWGVLHHTGALWEAVENTVELPVPGGLLCLGLYNWPGRPQLHLRLKRLYNASPELVRPLERGAYGVALLAAVLLLRRRNPLTYVASYHKRSRGMSFWRDVEDWLGGLPCEFASAAEVTSFVERHGFATLDVFERPPGANNDYLFKRLE